MIDNSDIWPSVVKVEKQHRGYPFDYRIFVCQTCGEAFAVENGEQLRLMVRNHLIGSMECWHNTLRDKDK